MKYKTIKNFKNKLQNSDNNEFVDLLFDFIKEEGKTNYDESVTQLQHSLQTASLARTEDGRRHIVIASLLHDIGHLLIDENDSKNDFLKKDLNHENIASNFLKDFFSEEITESIRLHVVAKRYLCSIDNSYYESLSKASKNSFQVQGGALNKEEINDLDEILKNQKRELKQLDKEITAFNIGVNIGRDAGQSIMHCHIHLIPRRKGDVDDPRGGVRGVIPEKQKYKRK